MPEGKGSKRTGTDRPLFGVRHYEAIADFLRFRNESIGTYEDVKPIEEAFADWFEGDNPSFKRSRFLKRMRYGEQ